MAKYTRHTVEKVIRETEGGIRGSQTSNNQNIRNLLPFKKAMLAKYQYILKQMGTNNSIEIPYSVLKPYEDKLEQAIKETE